MEAFRAENPPLATVNTHLSEGLIPCDSQTWVFRASSLGHGKLRTRGNSDSAKGPR